MDLRPDSMIRSLHDVLGQETLDGRAKKAALEMTSALAQSSRLVELLRSLHGDPQTTATCARQSYLHPLGFHKLMLINAAPRFELRCHVWWPDSSPGVDHVHNHRFAFFSAVVRGGYHMQVFQTDQAGTATLEYREMANPGTGWHLKPAGIAYLRLLSSIHHEQGTSYALEADVLHRVVVPSGTLCVTLVLRTELSGSTTRVFAGPGNATPTMTPVRVMSSADYRRQLEALLIELTG
jgi:hypothetical protein